MTNYCKVFFFNENTFQVLQFKHKLGCDFVNKYNGFTDDDNIKHYKIDVSELDKIIALGSPMKSRRSIKTIRKICSEKFNVKARPYNGKIWIY